YGADSVDRLMYDQTCVHNLAKYLLNRKDRATAIVAKPCDSRTINLLVNEKQILRDKVYVIGTTCRGMVDAVWDAVGMKPQDRCLRCVSPVPVVYDCLIGEQTEAAGLVAHQDVEDMEQKSVGERRQFWTEQFSRCIRCHACRQVCPGCYCSECFVDQLDPTWVGIRKTAADNEMWNTIRAFHLAGRCLSCNECERACPVNIPLGLLNRKLEKEVGEMFGFQAGLDAGAAPPFSTFKKDEHLKGTE
ncbi:MAG: 4Fe-4S dicluster domain-containing protein, partial [Chloroflexi bacterium]|nr:4Fe-4S dicluster domain-containing protein [Chloroflexota bacterium]